MSFSGPWKNHLLPGTDVVVTVRSSTKAYIGVCYTPDLIKGPLHLPDFTIMFIARAKRITEVVQPAFLKPVYVPNPVVALNLNLL